MGETENGPTGLQLDLLTVVARLEQIRDEGPGVLADHLLDRVLTCDLPRLRGYLTEETLRWGENTPR